MNDADISGTFSSDTWYFISRARPCGWASNISCWLLYLFLESYRSFFRRALSVLQIDRRKSCDLRKSLLYETCLTFIHSHDGECFCRYA